MLYQSRTRVGPEASWSWKLLFVLPSQSRSLRYSLVVRVVDHGGLAATSPVTVNVLNVNDVSVTGFEDTVRHSTLGGEYVKG
jgi:hypothetical protein